MELKTFQQFEVTLLYIEPSKKPSEQPLVDVYTKKMTAALRRPVDTGVLLGYQIGSNYEDVIFESDLATRGFHMCGCGKASSSNCDYRLPSGQITNSLAIHYLAFHREEVSQETLDIIAGFKNEEEPTEYELIGAIWKYHEEKYKERSPQE